jgi:hypothetical protein
MKKKLVLNKKVIASLNHDEMKKLNGGDLTYTINSLKSKCVCESLQVCPPVTLSPYR